MRKQPKPLKIKTPFPTMEQTRKKMGASKKELKGVERMVEESFAGKKAEPVEVTTRFITTKQLRKKIRAIEAVVAKQEDAIRTIKKVVAKIEKFIAKKHPARKPRR